MPPKVSQDTRQVGGGHDTQSQYLRDASQPEADDADECVAAQEKDKYRSLVGWYSQPCYDQRICRALLPSSQQPK
jgi:hypothetical protein